MKKVRILSLDGGGIRGIIPATIVEYIETEIQKRENNPNARIADYFDLIAGTSTGGILTCLYLTPNQGEEENGPSTKYSATEALEFYSKEGYKIFNESHISNWKRIWGLRDATEYSPAHIERLFKEKFQDLKLSELVKPCLVTTYNMKTKSSFFFNSREPKDMKREFYVRDVTRSTSAAPTYFPSAKISNLETKEQMVNIDGGVFANNPTMCAYSEARNTNFETRGVDEPSAREMIILSIGTGGGNFALPKVEESGGWNLLKWAKSIPEIMMDGSVDTVAFQMNEIFGTLEEEHQSSYKRVKVPEHARIYSPDMSDASPENIEKLAEAGKITLKHARENGLDKFIDQLLD